MFDLATMADLPQALSTEKFEELLSGFLDGRSRAIDELRLANADAARADLRSRAHALKGASLSLGLRRIGAIAEDLQAAAHVAPASELGRLIDRLDLQFKTSFEECVRQGVLSGALPLHALQSAVTPPEAPARA
jgi:HPt (histidine-containing phosphotransfer) domain-containing protein